MRNALRAPGSRVPIISRHNSEVIGLSIVPKRIPLIIIIAMQPRYGEENFSNNLAIESWIASRLRHTFSDSHSNYETYESR